MRSQPILDIGRCRRESWHIQSTSCRSCTVRILRKRTSLLSMSTAGFAGKLRQNVRGQRGSHVPQAVNLHLLLEVWGRFAVDFSERNRQEFQNELIQKPSPRLRCRRAHGGTMRHMVLRPWLRLSLILGEPSLRERAATGGDCTCALCGVQRSCTNKIATRAEASMAARPALRTGPVLPCTTLGLVNAQTVPPYRRQCRGFYSTAR